MANETVFRNARVFDGESAVAGSMSCPDGTTGILTHPALRPIRALTE
jgi:hypothetical protein